MLWRMFRRSKGGGEEEEVEESESCMVAEYGVRGNIVRYVQDQGRLVPGWGSQDCVEKHLFFNMSVLQPVEQLSLARLEVNFQWAALRAPGFFLGPRRLDVSLYGMREFLVISPGANCEAIISESKCNLLLSSVSISLANSGCQVPTFVQIQQKWRRMYAGECQGPGVRTDFEMVHLRKVPSQYNHLSGLLDIFKSKIACPLTPLPPITIAIRFTYVLQDWQQYSWPQQPPDFDALLGGEVGGVEFGKLPFGACEDPISELHLATTWPHLTEGIVVDNDVYSDLDPLQAPHWSVRVRKADNPQCLLGDFLNEFFKLCCRKESTEEILGRGLTEEEGKENSDLSAALSKLTEPAVAPVSRLSDVLNSILLYLFPDASVEKSASASDNGDSKARPPHSGGRSERDKDSDYNLFNQLKSAPSDSLTYRLALCVCLVNFYHGGVRALAHLWQEFVLEMRYRWENNYLVYG
ncbi:hypothetical protein NHX12_007169 [Muraenolepis orangiensis]|uniref:Rab3 GTPase-activating protein catalytic subunit n=1 Tax=Muraenolepis orangiensis TaxID=630683 RepID=A0A9Q0DME2_9TELE|nr:hypothetical protein NHX12_007169 [Muraenolepis orangiensis]